MTLKEWSSSSCYLYLRKHDVYWIAPYSRHPNLFFVIPPYSSSSLRRQGSSGLVSDSLLSLSLLQAPLVFTTLLEIPALRCRPVLIQQLDKVIDHDVLVKMIDMTGGSAHRDIGDIDDFYPRQALKVLTGLTESRITVNLPGKRQRTVVARYIDGDIPCQRSNYRQILFEYADIDIGSDQDNLVYQWLVTLLRFSQSDQRKHDPARTKAVTNNVHFTRTEAVDHVAQNSAQRIDTPVQISFIVGVICD